MHFCKKLILACLFWKALASPLSVFAVESSGAISPTVSQFDARRAFQHVEKQLSFGPRPSGSLELQKTRDYLIQELRSYGLAVEEQAFTEKTPRGSIRFVNVIARPSQNFLSSFWKGEQPKIVLASHYDTKWMPQIKFLGANDGASSTAILLEIARVVGKSRLQVSGAQLEFVFFDGEEATKDYGPEDGLHGSKYYVQQLKLKKSRVQALVLMDMVGDQDLSVQIPDGDTELTRKLIQSAENLNFRDYFRYVSRPMTDDHVPFVEEGIPAMDLIDFEYGPNNSWWHTEKDSLDKISEKSLQIVGQTVLQFMTTYSFSHPDKAQ